ncbi:MAG: hypothetical protein HRU70_00290 [Phycisphaeraceae bacterium]|nr:MAG: hypothetical protein HRU70_00290 [Phycisphaeraceae bacterium]
MNATPHTTDRANRRDTAGTYRNAALTAIAVLLGVIALKPSVPDLVPSAFASQPGSEPTGLSNALEQRKQMIAELRSISSRLDQLDGKITRGLSVKVTEMPELKLPVDLRRAITRENPRDASPAAGGTAAAEPAREQPRPGER